MNGLRRSTESGDDVPRHERLLRVWEATSRERDLDGVLRAVSRVLSEVIAVDDIGIVVFGEPSPQSPEGGTVDFELEGQGPKRARLYALLTPDADAGDRSRLREARKSPLLPPHRPVVPYDSEIRARSAGGEPYTHPDLLAKTTWYPHEHNLADAGIRAYASIPLLLHGMLIGTTVFSRRSPIAFSNGQLDFLRDLSQPIAVAVQSALANEEIKELRDQLEAESLALRARPSSERSFEGIVGSSVALRRVLRSVEQVAGTDTSVLVIGETGTGKELVAEAIHKRSSRVRRALVPVNCAAIPQTLLASELFGYERGAFTSATQRRKGRFQQADGGTIFLDEVGELAHEAQAMLLRVLQTREVERLGGSKPVRVDVRVIAATNRDLEEDVRAGHFRDDLYYRLNVFPIRVPPLRERFEDLPILVRHFIAKHAKRLGRSITRVDRSSLRRLESYSWPGNVRELENVIERAMILSTAGTLRVDEELLSAPQSTGDVKARLREQERHEIEEALRQCRGRVAGDRGAAKLLGLPASTLEYRVKRLAIDKYRFRSNRGHVASVVEPKFG